MEMSQTNQGSNTEMQILNDVALFDFIIAGSTGEKTVEANDFIREVGKMLPTGTFSWVSKYRNEAKREIMKVGVSRRVNNRVRGYFVPKEAAQKLSEVLKQIKQEFASEKARFLSGLPQIVEEWASSPVNSVPARAGNAETRGDLIRKHAPKPGDLDKALSFDTSAILVQGTSYFGNDDALYSEVRGLVGQAALEIAEDVKKSWSGPAAGRTSSRVLGLIKRIRYKAKCMAILSPKFGQLGDLCDTVLQAVPEGQNIEGVQFLVVSGLLSRCMNPNDILSDDLVNFNPLDVEHATNAPAATSTSAAPVSSPVATQLDLTMVQPAEIQPTVSVETQPVVAADQSSAPVQAVVVPETQAVQPAGGVPGFDTIPETPVAPSVEAVDSASDAEELCI
jgi:hypothetical protein